MNAQPRHILGSALELADWRSQVDRALRGTAMTFEQVADAIDERRMFMFCSDEAFVVLEPQGDDDNRQVMVVVGGGTQNGLEAVELAVTIWGRMIGARKIVALAREGFWRRVKRQGWKKARVLIEKEI
jgi:hypothetical protein